MIMWNKTLFDFSHTEHFLMSCFCTPCLFGMNKAKLDTLNGVPNASMIPGCFSYSAINVGWQVAGIMYSTAFSTLMGIPPVPEVTQISASLCGAIGTGIYASRTRNTIREKYNIEGTRKNDTLVHTFLPQCAVCQEANEIEYQTHCPDSVHYTYTTVPDCEPMTKDT